MSFVGDLMADADNRAAYNTSVNRDAGALAASGSRHLNELDVSKIVAQKYAKNA
jgi:hypothetical protein